MAFMFSKADAQIYAKNSHLGFIQASSLAAVLGALAGSRSHPPLSPASRRTPKLA